MWMGKGGRRDEREMERRITSERGGYERRGETGRELSVEIRGSSEETDVQSNEWKREEADGQSTSDKMITG